VVACALAVSGNTLFADSTSWNVGTGSWSVASNWTGGVPTSSIDAVFAQDATYQVFLSGSSQARSIALSRGSIDLAAAVPSTLLVLGSGGAYVSVGTLSAGSPASVSLQTGVGTVTTSGLYVGGVSSGSLLVANGWRVSGGKTNIGDGGSGYVSVTGANTRLSSSLMSIGLHSAGSGTMRIANSGTVSASDVVYVGVDTGRGTLTIDGSGSRLTTTNAVIVGGTTTGVPQQPAEGNLSVSSGATLSADVGMNIGNSGNRGTATFNNGVFTSTNFGIGVGVGSSGSFFSAGTLTCTTNTSLNMRGMTIGSNGGSGTVAFSGTSNTVNSTGNLNLGPNGTGQLSLTGTTWDQSTDCYVGGSSSTTTGVGTLNIGIGANVSIAGLTKVNSQGVLRYSTGSLSLATLTVAGGLVDVTVSADKLLPATVVSTTAGGKIDLNDNDLIATATTYDGIRTQIASARGSGSWTGAGITSTTARNHPSHNTTLGILTGAQYTSVYGPGASFDGHAVAGSDTLVKYTWYGDSDFNGKVNFDDYVRTDNGFNNHLTGWFNGDFDYNNLVNFDDYVLIDLAFNTQSGTLRRALAFLDGSDRDASTLDSPALRKVRDHLMQFGQDYANHFLAAVPEPVAVAISLPLVVAPLLARRQKRGTTGPF
jgi:T5SS/PEP-CTERM-associated repeat protein